jgi:RNA polymerase sigma-54 factor
LSIAKEILFNPKYLNFDDAKNSLIEEHSEISIEQILSKIKKCNLSPGFEFQPTELIQPDLEVLPINDSRLDVKFREDHFPNIALDEDLAKLTKDKKNKANNTLKEKISDAKWLIRAINKRNETVHSVGALICQIQADFLLNVSAELKPLTNIELAKNLKISASTVSRILRSKYIQTPKGAISMKSLLISSVSKTRKVTPAQLMEEIKGIVESESQTLSDQKISDMLNKRGFNLARRTISKYRMRVNIPSSRNR